jgi:hypothetical protein
MTLESGSDVTDILLYDISEEPEPAQDSNCIFGNGNSMNMHLTAFCVQQISL